MVGGCTTMFNRDHATTMGCTAPFNRVHATTMGCTTPFNRVHATIMTWTLSYSAVHALLFGEYFVLRAAVLAIHDRRVAIAVVLVVAVADSVAGAEDVGRGVKAALVEADEVMLVGKAASVGNFAVGQLGVEQ